jgi:hypothetical protein
VQNHRGYLLTPPRARYAAVGQQLHTAGDGDPPTTAGLRLRRRTGDRRRLTNASTGFWPRNAVCDSWRTEQSRQFRPSFGMKRRRRQRGQNLADGKIIVSGGSDVTFTITLTTASASRGSTPYFRKRQRHRHLYRHGHEPFEGTFSPSQSGAGFAGRRRGFESARRQSRSPARRPRCTIGSTSAVSSMPPALSRFA